MCNHRRFLLTFALLIGPVAHADEAQLAGRVIDQSAKPVAEALLFVLDHPTGLPVVADTFQPMTVETMSKMVTVVTGEQGEFAIRPVKPGTYKLIAQSHPSSAKSDR